MAKFHAYIGGCQNLQTVKPGTSAVAKNIGSGKPAAEPSVVEADFLVKRINQLEVVWFYKPAVHEDFMGMCNYY